MLALRLSTCYVGETLHASIEIFSMLRWRDTATYVEEMLQRMTDFASPAPCLTHPGMIG